MTSSQPTGPSIGQRIAPPRFLIFFSTFLAGMLAYRQWVRPGVRWNDWADALAMGFDLGAFVFLASLTSLLRKSSPAEIRRHAGENDANRGLVLMITTLLSVVVLAAISEELPAARNGEAGGFAKLIGTLLLAWLFANTVYALHYAHQYYGEHPATGEDRGGIAFPGTSEPDYADFLYFAFTLGMTFQTSDCDITDPAIRRVVLLHSLAAFIFNMGVIAFTINAIGGGR